MQKIPDEITIVMAHKTGISQLAEAKVDLAAVTLYPFILTFSHTLEHVQTHQP